MPLFKKKKKKMQEEDAPKINTDTQEVELFGELKKMQKQDQEEEEQEEDVSENELPPLEGATTKLDKRQNLLPWSPENLVQMTEYEKENMLYSMLHELIRLRQEGNKQLVENQKEVRGLRQDIRYALQQ